MNEALTTQVSPIHVSFPLHRRPELAVSVSRRFTTENRGNLVSIEVVRAVNEPVEITRVSVGFLHTFLPAELLLGKKAARFPLHDLMGAPRPPYVLDHGSIRWTADLDQVKEELLREQLRLSPRLRRTYAELAEVRWPHLDHFYTELADIDPEADRVPRGPLAARAHDAVRHLTHRRLAVVVEDARGGLYKAKARWEPP